MERGRILILGQTKENSFEIRNLLDNRRFELEIALNPEVAKKVLTSRFMDLMIIHTEMMGVEGVEDFFEFLDDHGITVPIMFLGEEARSYGESITADYRVLSFDKPYPVEELLSAIHAL